ncbi:PREDICTED: stress-response A/B barrel domain-containing protein UP3 [Lupinus angustifolius]|nr:PREDICTED: stress-response A/B barrel domain-containing protein UP3 [Lupinus angustifolius]
MLCLRSQLSYPFSSSSLSRAFSPSKHLRHHFKPYSQTPPSNFSIKMTSSQTIEHIVLFKVKEDTDPSKITAMVNGLNSLTSLDQVLHLSVGPILRNRSSSFTFTHLLHSRYNSKQDLESYSAHPNHLSVVKGSVLPIVDDIMAVDWIAHDLVGDLVPPQGSAIRVSFLKLKENVGDQVKDEVIGVIKGIPDNFKGISQLSVGENFSPARAKGFSIASLAVFPGTRELEAVDSNPELVNYQKDKVRDHLENVLVLDYVVPAVPAYSASL